MVINGIDCGDEKELSGEEYSILLKLIRNWPKFEALIAERDEQKKLLEDYYLKK